MEIDILHCNDLVATLTAWKNAWEGSYTHTWEHVWGASAETQAMMTPRRRRRPACWTFMITNAKQLLGTRCKRLRCGRGSFAAGQQLNNSSLCVNVSRPTVEATAWHWCVYRMIKRLIYRVGWVKDGIGIWEGCHFFPCRKATQISWHQWIWELKFGFVNCNPNGQTFSFTFLSFSLITSKYFEQIR